jgi:hypothetical protein
MMAGYKADRLFRVSSFNPNHRQLIIRSDPEPGPGRETRVELYFGNVRYMALQPILRRVDVRRATPDEGVEVGDRFGLPMDAREYLFLLDTAEPMSFVVSGKPSWREAVRAFDEPSLFDFSQAWPPGPEMTYGEVS